MTVARVLCLNCGSSSLKFAIYTPNGEGEALRCHGSVDGIGLDQGRLEICDDRGATLVTSQDPSSDHGAALEQVLAALAAHELAEVDAVGHRVVHGGPLRTGPARVDPALLEELRGRIEHAPLHLPQEIRMIEATVARWPGLPQVACFDTAFHRRMPEHAQRLPLPASLLEAGVRRYGFHGLSYEYVVQTLGDEVRGRVVVAHLGHGSSLSGLLDGRPMYTTMGFTPTGGVMMSTRSGDLDPGVLLHLLDARGWEPARVARLVNEEAGLLGVSGRSADMRRLLELREQDARADQAVAMYCSAVRRAIGALAAELGGLDLLVFTGGIGEHAPSVRDEICRGLGHLGVGSTASTERRSRVRVVPTNENLMIARHTWQIVFGARGVA